MGYSLHINPSENFQSESAWRNAVEACQYTRLTANDIIPMINPATGEAMKIRSFPTDVEIYFADEDTWQTSIFWRAGTASISARALTLGDEKDSAWLAVREICSLLDAQLIGDEGEIYDPQSGKMIRDHFGKPVS